MDKTVNYECDELVGIDLDVAEHIDVSLEQSTVDEHFDDLLYELIYRYYDVIIKDTKIQAAIHPSSNSYTQHLLTTGHTQEEANIQAICLLFYIIKKLNFN